MKIKETKFEVENRSILVMSDWCTSISSFLQVKWVDERPIGWFFFDETSETNYMNFKKLRGKSILVEIMVDNYAIEYLLPYFQPNVTLLNEPVFVTAAVISPVTIIPKPKCFKLPKWK